MKQFKMGAKFYKMVAKKANVLKRNINPEGK